MSFYFKHIFLYNIYLESTYYFIPDRLLQLFEIPLLQIFILIYYIYNIYFMENKSNSN